MPYLYADIETIGHECAVEFVPPPDLSQITAARNLKDPIKIAADIAQRQAEAVAEHGHQLGKAALDWNLNQIVAIGYHDGYDLKVLTCPDEASEALALNLFWSALRHHSLVGFCARTFDAPTLIQRSRLLGVKHPRLNLGRWGRGDVIDIRDILTFDDARYEAVMPRSLKAFAKRFGIKVDDLISGADIPRLVQEGSWEAVRAHVTSDVQLTMALAAKLGIHNSEGLLPMSEAQEKVGF